MKHGYGRFREGGVWHVLNAHGYPRCIVFPMGKAVERRIELTPKDFETSTICKRCGALTWPETAVDRKPAVKKVEEPQSDWLLPRYEALITELRNIVFGGYEDIHLRGKLKQAFEIFDEWIETQAKGEGDVPVD